MMGARFVAGAKVVKVFGVDVSEIDPVLSVELTRAALAADAPTQGAEVSVIVDGC